MSSLASYSPGFVEKFKELLEAQKKNLPEKVTCNKDDELYQSALDKSRMQKRFFVWIVNLSLTKNNDVIAKQFIEDYDGLDNLSGFGHLEQELNNVFENEKSLWRNSLYYQFSDYIGQEILDNSYIWKEIEKIDQIYDDISDMSSAGATVE